MPYEKQQQILKEATSAERAGNQAQAEWGKTHASKSWVAMDLWGNAQDSYETIIEWAESLKEPLDPEQTQIFSKALLGLNRLAQIKEMLLEPLPLNETTDALLSETIDESLKKIAAELLSEVESELLADKEMLTVSNKFLTLRIKEKNATEKEVQADYKEAMMLANDVLNRHPNANIGCHLTWLKLATTAFEKNTNIKEKETIYRVINKRFDLILEKIKNLSSKEYLLSLADTATSWGSQWINKNSTKMKRWFEAAITCYTLYVEHKPESSEQLYDSYNDIAGISKLLWHYSPEKESSYLNAAILWFRKTIDQKKDGAANFKHLVSKAEIALAEIYYIQDRSSDQALTAFGDILNDPEFDFTVFPKEKVHFFLGEIYIERHFFVDAEIQYRKAQEIGGIYTDSEILEDAFTGISTLKNQMLTELQKLLNDTSREIKNFDAQKNFDGFHEAYEKCLNFLAKNPSYYPNLFELHGLRGYLYALSGANEQAFAQYNCALNQAANYLIQNKPAEASKIYLYLCQHSIKGSVINQQALFAYREAIRQLKEMPYTENTKGLMFSEDTQKNNNKKTATVVAKI